MEKISKSVSNSPIVASSSSNNTKHYGSTTTTMKKKSEESELLPDRCEGCPQQHIESIREELKEMKSYCHLYARLYSELKLEFLQMKHVLLSESSGPTDGKFTNTPNGLSFQKNAEEESGSMRHEQDLQKEVEDLREQVRRLEIENRELKSKVVVEGNGAGGSKESPEIETKFLDKDDVEEKSKVS